MIGFFVDTDRLLTLGFGFLLGVFVCGHLVGFELVIGSLFDATIGLAEAYLRRLWRLAVDLIMGAIPWG